MVFSSEPTWRVERWQVDAQPILWHEGDPSLTISRRSSVNGKSGPEQAGIQVNVAFEATADGTAPGLWPDASTVQLVRAQTTNGTYQVVHAWGQAEVRQPLESSDGHVKINGQSQPRRHYRFSLTDQQAETGKR